MFEASVGPVGEAAEAPPATRLPAGSFLASFTTLLGAAAAVDTDPDRIDALRAFERAKCMLEAAQAAVAVAFDTSQRAAQQAAGVPAAHRGRGVAAQVALARRESPYRGAQQLGLAKVLCTEMPHTRAAFGAGRISEWRATLLARETACLDLEHRRVVDKELAADPDTLERMGERELVAAAAALAYRLDPRAVVARRSAAETERRVGLRPAPDVMSRLCALLPVADGVAVFTSLHRAAAAGHADGDPRSKGQIMADTLITRITGHQPSTQASAQPAQPVTGQPVTGQLVTGRASAPCHGAAKTGDAIADANTDAVTKTGRAHRDDVEDEVNGVADIEDGGVQGVADGGEGLEAVEGVDAGMGDAISERHPATAAGHLGASAHTGNVGPAAQPAPAGAAASKGLSRHPVLIHLLVSDAILLGGHDGTAHLDGFGPIPADLARDLATQAGIDGRAWLRRVYTTPGTGDLLATDTRARLFPAGLAQLVRLRDRTCRTPWCDAPIREIDHPESVDEGGPTSLRNGQGLCSACNRAKQAPGWHARPAPGPRHIVSTATPTGHTYRSRAPAAEQPLAS